MKLPLLRLSSTTVALAFLGVQAASAQDIQKANNTTALNLAGSWTGESVPGSGNRAVYTGLGSLSTALGADLSWQGIRHAGNTGTWTITGSNTLTLGSSGIEISGTGSGGVTINSNVIQGANASYVTANGRNITLGGSLSGSGNINVSGTGLLLLNGNNSGYTGVITTSARISVGSDTALGTQSLVMNNGSFLNAGGVSRTLANGITVSGGVTLETVNSSRNLTLNGVISGSGSVTKAGTGVLTLNNNNSYSGTTTVSAGTLLINGYQTGVGQVTVGSAGTLGGSGNIAGSLHFDAGANFVFSLTDTLTVNGANVSFAGFSMSNVIGLDSSVASGIYELINGAASIDFTNVSNVGFANAFDLGDGRSAYFRAGSLEVVVVPEPGTAAFLIVGLALVPAYRRLRKAI